MTHNVFQSWNAVFSMQYSVFSIQPFFEISVCRVQPSVIFSQEGGLLLTRVILAVRESANKGEGGWELFEDKL